MAKRKEPPKVVPAQGFTTHDFLQLVQSPSWTPTTPFPIFAREYEGAPAFTVTKFIREQKAPGQPYEISIHITDEAMDSITGDYLDIFKEALAALVDGHIAVFQEESKWAEAPPAGIPVEAPVPSGEYEALAGKPAAEPDDLTYIQRPGGDLDLVEEVQETRESLRCRLTNEEILEYSRQAARANAEIQLAEDELKAIKSDYKFRIDKAQATLNECSGKVNTGHEMRQVDCKIFKNYARNTITAMRMDTLEVVRVRAMTADERQRGLEFESGPEPEPSPGDAAERFHE